ncbi:hypothetical protein DOJK_01042 [Patescibacteria group bacterium]|nr:hypothetical protein DOJK_01042 [Patescibacteria group bacterium]
MSEKTKIIMERDKKLDTFVARIREIEHPLETEVCPLFDGNILFKVDSVTGELVQIFIYDFSIIRRKLLVKLLFLYTTESIRSWLEMLISSFTSGQHAKQLAHN